MLISEVVRTAFASLRSNAMRSLLTMLGIIIGVAAVIAMVSVGAGAQERIAEQIRSMGSNLIVVFPGAQTSGGIRWGLGSQQTLTEEDARAIAIGALRYFLLKVGRNKVIAFDFDEALNFEGDTGPYLQYSLVRVGNIFRKLRERGIAHEVSLEDVGVALEGEEWTDDLWAIALDAASIPDAAERSVEALEPATLARHAFGLAQAFRPRPPRSSSAGSPRRPGVSRPDCPCGGGRLGTRRPATRTGRCPPRG